MPHLIQALPDGPLDLIGDIHGEIEALLNLLHRLGVDPDKRTAKRRVVFLGDLIDRGPNSVAVVEVVQRLVHAGIAQVVLGNHELNVLRGSRKEGNGWFFGDPTDHSQLKRGPVRFESQQATPAEREGILAFLRELPLVLAREDLQVVHACPEPSALQLLPPQADVVTLFSQHEHDVKAELMANGMWDLAAEERSEFAQLVRRDVVPTRHLPAVAAVDEARQSRNPVRVLTSGREVEIAAGAHQFLGGRWRFVRRDEWWQRWSGKPTVVGHYWRRRYPAPGRDPFFDAGLFHWTHGVFCVDYSVGRRYAEREHDVSQGFRNGLAALRWPERVLAFDDRAETVQTEGF